MCRGSRPAVRRVRADSCFGMVLPSPLLPSPLLPSPLLASPLPSLLVASWLPPLSLGLPVLKRQRLQRKAAAPAAAFLSPTRRSHQPRALQKCAVGSTLPKAHCRYEARHIQARSLDLRLLPPPSRNGRWPGAVRPTLKGFRNRACHPATPFHGLSEAR